MKLVEADGTSIKIAVTGMIVSREVLGRLAAVWRPGAFGQPWADRIAEWCVTFYNTFRRPPKKLIRDLFRIWAEEQAHDQDTEKAIAAFLGGLSDEYDPESFNPGYAIDLAGRAMNRARLEAVRDKLSVALEIGDLDKAETALVSSKVEVGAGSYLDLFSSPAAVKAAVLSKTKVKPLVTFDGALGTFMEPLLVRDAFVAFEAPEKRGKSFCLQEVAWQGVLQGRRVAFFSCGDMSEEQMSARLITRAMERPLRAMKELEVIRLPVYLERSGLDATAVVTHKEASFHDDVEWKAGWRRLQKVWGERDKFRLATHPAGTLTVAAIADVLDRWETVDKWVPDIVAIDYADILAPPPGRMESREAIDKNWMMLRSMSTARHVLVVTASQTDADSYDVEIITKGNFSGSKTKNAHVTAMIAINQTPAEKDQGLYRLSLPAARESALSESTCVYVAGCLGIASPFILSIF